MMECPITELMNKDECEQWIEEHFHPEGLKCPRCSAGRDQAHIFRETRKSKLTVYRCNVCQQPYNLYSRTVFEQRHLTPQQVVLLLRGILKGEPANTLAAELDLNYKTVLKIRRDLHRNAIRLQPKTPLPDAQTETDEMFQNAGEKRG